MSTVDPRKCPVARPWVGTEGGGPPDRGSTRRQGRPPRPGQGRVSAPPRVPRLVSPVTPLFQTTVAEGENDGRQGLTETEGSGAHS